MVYIPGVFLTADMDKDLIMVLQGRLAELMLKTEKSIYQKCVTIENGWTILYLKLQKAPYRCLKIAQLFDEKIVADPNSRGFIINSYDLCVSNIMVNINQITITWNINDLRVSHVDAYEVIKLIDWMKGI